MTTRPAKPCHVNKKGEIRSHPSDRMVTCARCGRRMSKETQNAKYFDGKWYHRTEPPK